VLAVLAVLAPVAACAPSEEENGPALRFSLAPGDPSICDTDDVEDARCALASFVGTDNVTFTIENYGTVEGNVERTGDDPPATVDAVWPTTLTLAVSGTSETAVLANAPTTFSIAWEHDAVNMPSPLTVDFTFE
jgi:hypothetical protein